MKADTVALVGKFQIPVVRAKFCTIVQFSAGVHGKRERGDYCFWTARLKKPAKGARAGKRQLIGRAYAWLPPGDRFARMERESSGKTDASEYHYLWHSFLKRGQNIQYIRPSTRAEVQRWIDSHLSDAKFIKRIIMRGEVVK